MNRFFGILYAVAVLISGKSVANNLYISGIDGSTSQVALWITDEAGNQEASPFPVDLGGVTMSYYYNACSPSRVYVAGINNAVHPSLWITDLKGNQIPSSPVVLSTTTFFEIAGIAVSSDRVYMSGHLAGADGMGLWITDLDGVSILNSPIVLRAGTSITGALACSSSNVYIPVVDNTGVYLVITDLNGNLVSTTTLPNGTNSLNNSCVAVSDTHAYIACLDASSKVSLWITDLQGNVITTSPINLPTSMGNYSGFLGNIALSSSAVYIAGQDSSTNAALWITDLEGNIITPTGYAIELPGGSAGTPYGLAVSSSGVYIGGQISNSAVMWISNFQGTEISSVTFPPSGNGIVNSIAFPVSDIQRSFTRTDFNRRP